VNHLAVRTDLPSGTVTFLFTDIEGSTELLHDLGAEGYAEVLAEHRRVLREAFTRHGGVEVDTQGDAFFVAFPTAPGAIAAASEAQAKLAIPVRMGIHTGTPHLAQDGYVGADVHRAARIAAAGHGGQALVSAATAALVGTDGLVELGEHRLKDFEQAVPLYQLGEESFPPLKTISNTNLPRPASSFVGREREVEEIAALLRDRARLLTLTGPGGTGKTRLALEAATELVPEFKAGAFWVGLAPLRDPALVTETIAHTLGAEDGLAAHIAERELLLLLDNLEQVVEAAPELASLVETCPNLRLLVTSRELLRVRGEVEYPVAPLDDPEAVALFCERARTEPDAVVSAICRALDMLPLALELAAARASVLSSKQILDRLSQRLDLLKGGRDADPRQQTLRATIEWSHELLSAEEQRLFARLSVFRGGCTLDAAEDVCEADLDTLQSLVDKSLLSQRDERFWMLETIREYAAEQLEASGEAAIIRDRHLDHFVTLGERAYEGQRVASEGIWFPILEAEHDNLRAALDWARERKPAEEARLAGAVAPYWMMRGHTREAQERLTGALGRYDTRDAVRARALTHHGEGEDAIPTLEEALTLWREIGDARGEALALEAIGWAHDHHGDYAAAGLAHEESLAVRAHAGVPELEGALARAGLCHVLVATGEVERAEATAEGLLAIAAQADAPLMHQLALHFLADCPLVAGDYAEAEQRYLRALAYARAAGLPGRATDEVLGVAMAVAGRGEPARAVRLAAAAHAEQMALAKSTDRWWATMQTRLLGGARASLSPEEGERAERAGRGTAFDEVLDELLGREDD
jgi:predicted ATPase/class 3 adenylate cyclase